MKEAIMAKQYEILDRYGRIVEGDVIPEGGRLRVSMMMRDGMSELQQAVAEVSEARHFPVVDGLGRPVGRRPGACYLRPAPDGSPEHAAQIASDRMRREAYADSVKELTDAWRQPSPTPPVEPRVHVGGGARGQMRVPDERQDAVPRGPVYDVVEGQRVKDEAYRAMVDELTTAWQRKP
jgi:hypothetical protein